MSAVQIHKESPKKWYCLKCQPRMETLAAESLKQLPEVDVFYPRTNITKKTPSNSRKIQRALFPGYLFTSFDPVRSIRAVNYCQGVAYIVSHGNEPVEVHSAIIGGLKSITSNDVLQMPNSKPTIGQSVKVLHGLFDGDQATVSKLIPEKKRVQVLLEILGTPCHIEISEELVDAGTAHPLHLISKAN
jgi:transcription antitermination factor NusG